MRQTRLLPADPASVREAARLLAEGALVAFPTETVYGLGARASSDKAVAAIFAAKARPQFNPLIVHVADIAEARKLGRFDARAEELAQCFWPGPLTLVLPRTETCDASLLASAGLDSIALRLPSHPVALSLLKACGFPVAAPSANASGQISPTAALHVQESLNGRIDLILDGGPCAVGVESTVIDLTGKTAAILRPGGITPEELEPILGPIKITGANAKGLLSPGQLESHYAPHLPVRLDVTQAQDGEAFLAFGPLVPQGCAHILNLSPLGDLAEAAANLFAMLRQLDRPEWKAINVAPIPERGLGLAINDRLRRAAAPRIQASS